MCKLPIEILLNIYGYDNTYQIKMRKCIEEIEYIQKLHTMIFVTYNNVVEEQKKYFNFNVNFYLYCSRYNRTRAPGKKIMFRNTIFNP